MGKIKADAPSQAHLQGTQSRHTKANLAKEPALFLRFLGHTLPRWTQTFNSNRHDEGRTHNREFAAMLADEYILSFISLSAHIQPTEFYQLLLLSSSSVFQSAAAPGWTL